MSFVSLPVARVGTWASLLTCVAWLACLAGCGQKEKGPVTAESSSFQVADEGTASRPAGEAAKAPAGFAGAVGAAAGSGPGTPAVKVTDQPSGGPAKIPVAEPAPAGGQIPPPPPPPTPPLQPQEMGEAFVIPDGQEALLAFIQEMQQRAPQGANREQALESLRQIQGVCIAAAEKLWNTATDPKARISAVQAKLLSLRLLAGNGIPDADKTLHAYCRQLLTEKEPAIARLGRVTLFRVAIDELMLGKINDIPKIVAELKGLVAHSEQDPDVFGVTTQAAIVLQQMGHKDAALEAFRLIGAAYAKSTDAEVAAGVRMLQDRVKVIELDLEGKLQAMLTGQPDSIPAVLAAVQTLLSDPNLGPGLLDAAAQTAQVMEWVQQYEAASQAFAMVEKAFQQHPDKQLAEQAARMAENCRRRLALLGKPFAVTGVLADGTPFDWNAYKGKVVLVDFWATDSDACLSEIRDLVRNYQRYHEQGFEIVGVNLDDDPQAVERFFQVQRLPWTTVFSADPAARRFNHPLAVQCGVDSIPFVVLVDRDGTVKALHVRGPEIDRQLAALFGPPPAEPAPGAAPPKPAAAEAPSSLAPPADVAPPPAPAPPQP